MRSSISTAILVLAFAAVAPAAELVVRDLQVGLSSRPLGFDFTVDSRSGQATGKDAFDSALGIEGGGRWSFSRPGDAVGLVVGADVMLDAWSYQGAKGLGTSWGRVSAGPGWAISDTVTATVEVGAQYGVSALSLPATTTAPAFNATGSASGFDLRAGATWMLSRGFGVGGHAGWLVANQTLTGDRADITLKQSGWFVGLELVWRFSDAPSLLE